ncbi:hypothetical protein B0T14DRAFT_570344 [Immersiella caudata]|uniref:C2H2-type domain-containing protein n=1 Tax=Immersiella caudata TaxID=314043 RepID=A0AA40BUQ7_9PEZI|nr:hypothetical protein B0T14DRAFT_570344 [Immersiella caudata]
MEMFNYQSSRPETRNAEPDPKSSAGDSKSGDGGDHGPASGSATIKDKGKSVSRSKAGGASSRKTDDWSEINSADGWRRIQNRIAQRKFREKAREQMQRAQREAANELHASNSYYIAPEAHDEQQELSGLPWGSLSMRPRVNRRHQDVPSYGFLDGTFEGTGEYRGIPKAWYSDANVQVPEALKSGGGPVESLTRLTSSLSLKPSLAIKQSTRDSPSYEKQQDDSGTSSETQIPTTAETETASFRSPSASPSSSRLLFPILDRNRKNAIDSLMTEFEALLNNTLCQGSRSRGARSGSSRGSATATGASQGFVGAPTVHSSKRPRDGDGRSDPDPSDSEDERSGEPKRTKLTPGSDSQRRRLACPYNRRDPHKHNKHRSCNGPGWSTVHRVKEHIYRTHALPTHCARCGEEFQNEAELTGHQRLAQGCEVRDVEQAEGFTKDQEKALRKRTKGLESEEEKWKETYRILFSDDPEDTIPTPYYDDGDTSWESRRDDEFDRYERYLRRELPRAVRTRLEEAVASFSDPFVRQLRSQLVDIVRDTQAQLFRDYRHSMQAQHSAGDGRGLITAQFDAPREFSDIFLDLSAFSPPSPLLESETTLGDSSQPDPPAITSDKYYLSPYDLRQKVYGDSSAATLDHGGQPEFSTSTSYSYYGLSYAQPSDSGYGGSIADGEKGQDPVYYYDYDVAPM